MADYEKLYHLMFNAVTDALNQMEKGEYKSAKDTLVNAQTKAEDLFILTEEQKEALEKFNLRIIK